MTLEQVCIYIYTHIYMYIYIYIYISLYIYIYGGDISGEFRATFPADLVRNFFSMSFFSVFVGHKGFRIVLAWAHQSGAILCACGGDFDGSPQDCVIFYVRKAGNLQNESSPNFQFPRESEELQNEISPNFSNFCPGICPEFCSDFPPNFLMSFRASVRGKRRPEKNHPKSPPFFKAKFPAKHEKNIHKMINDKCVCRAGKVKFPRESFWVIFYLAGYFCFTRLLLETLRKYPFFRSIKLTFPR